MTTEHIEQRLLQLGALKAGTVACRDIPFHAEFRAACESNSCGMYGRCWMCPPDVGDIDALIEKAKRYSWAVVYQTVSPLEDSFDIEGMLEAGEAHNRLTQAIADELNRETEGCLHLGAGGCRICERCSKRDGEPCRFPDRALPSLEAYGIAVSELAPLCGMNYINGQNTVTYFGAVLLPATITEGGG